MKIFSVQFEEQDAFEIEYKGKTIKRFYVFDKKGHYKMKFSFVSTNSAHEQAIVFHLDQFRGKLLINGKEQKKPKGRFPQFMFTEKYASRQFEVEVILEEGDIGICNGYFHSQMPQICQSLVWGCAIIIEELGENSMRFYCNDGDNDDDFDDLIFDLEIVEI